MKRHKALILLSHDHHKGLLLAQLLKKNAPAYKGLPTSLVDKMRYTLDAYSSELAIHFKDEEEILFPLLRGKSSDLNELIDKLLQEHIDLNERIADLKDDDQLQDKLDKIGNILERHIRKEERQLFQQAQKVLSENELESIRGRIDKSREDLQKECTTKNKTIVE